MIPGISVRYLLLLLSPAFNAEFDRYEKAEKNKKKTITVYWREMEHELPVAMWKNKGDERGLNQ